MTKWQTHNSHVRKPPEVTQAHSIYTISSDKYITHMYGNLQRLPRPTAYTHEHTIVIRKWQAYNSHVRKPPEVAKTHSIACTGEEEIEFVAPVPPLLIFITTGGKLWHRLLKCQVSILIGGNTTHIHNTPPSCAEIESLILRVPLDNLALDHNIRQKYRT